jgi:hypothetical protein
LKITLNAKQKDQILYAVRHHAKSLEPMVTELICRIALSDALGEFGSTSNGPNSNYIERTKKRYYLSGRPALGEIWVRPYSRPRAPYVWRVLKTRMDVNNLCDELGI